jgi:gliding motility-associated-like protein
MWMSSQTNLVLNPSLEDTICCPLYPWNITCAEYWYQPNTHKSSTDYFHPCSPSFYNAIILGHQIHPKTGESYAGIITSWPLNPYNNDREYLCGTLLHPLDSGTCYFVSFHAAAFRPFSSMSENFGSDRLGVWFSNDSILTYNTSFDVINVVPYVEYSGGYICDPFSWVEVSGIFIAKGGEKHFAIGNFYDDNQTIPMLCNQGFPEPVITGVFIDDVSVWPCDAPVYEADAGGDKQICYGDEVILGQNLPDDEYRFLWSSKSHQLTTKDQWDTLATTPYLLVKPEQTTTYYLWVRDFKLDITYDSVTVFVESCITPPEIPNVFTPNGDGFNDLFAFKNHELWELETCIRNRWGMVVFEGKNDHWWDGTIQGQPAAEGVYFYTVTARNQFGQHKEFHGVVTLLR